MEATATELAQKGEACLLVHKMRPSNFCPLCVPVSCTVRCALRSIGIWQSVPFYVVPESQLASLTVCNAGAQALKRNKCSVKCPNSSCNRQYNSKKSFWYTQRTTSLSLYYMVQIDNGNAEEQIS